MEQNLRFGAIFSLLVVLKTAQPNLLLATFENNFCNVRTKKLQKCKLFLYNLIMNLKYTQYTQSIVGCSSRDASLRDLYKMALLTLRYLL